MHSIWSTNEAFELNSKGYYSVHRILILKLAIFKTSQSFKYQLLNLMCFHMIISNLTVQKGNLVWMHERNVK